MAQAIAQDSAQTTPNAARHRFVALFRDALPLAILSIALIVTPILLLEPQGLPRVRALERELEQLNAENIALEQEIRRLRLQVKRLKDDLETIEQVARTELGLVRKSEIVIQIPKSIR